MPVVVSEFEVIEEPIAARHERDSEHQAEATEAPPQLSSVSFEAELCQLLERARRVWAT